MPEVVQYVPVGLLEVAQVTQRSAGGGQYSAGRQRVQADLAPSFLGGTLQRSGDDERAVLTHERETQHSQSDEEGRGTQGRRRRQLDEPSPVLDVFPPRTHRGHDPHHDAIEAHADDGRLGQGRHVPLHAQRQHDDERADRQYGPLRRFVIGADPQQERQGRLDDHEVGYHGPEGVDEHGGRYEEEAGLAEGRLAQGFVGRNVDVLGGFDE
mmetsp:Transcript_35917/g.107303  ORF Transcript_35917/g.107303 Transcript_35917/m.107303 type:complete len:211 (-) Transcript_35917:401-1033(-)